MCKNDLPSSIIANWRGICCRIEYMDNWTEKNNCLQKTFVFKNFKEAIAFVNKVGEIAEKMQHHPDICIQNYKEVFISTTTHDKGSIVTEKDRTLVNEINTLQ